MKLLSTSQELKAIKSICLSSPKISGLILGSLKSAHFHYPPAREAYQHVMRLVRDTGEVPEWDTLASDPVLKVSTRRVLKNATASPVTNKARLRGLVKSLDSYRKLRTLLDAGRTIMESFNAEAVDVDKLLDHASSMLANARSGAESKQSLFHLGKGNNSTGLLKELLYGEIPPTIATHFKAFDSRNSGFLRGSLVLIGATTGGGKTSMAVNLLRNMAEFGCEDVALVSLEMSATQNLARLQSILTGIPVGKISQQKLTKKERIKIKKTYRKWVLDRKQQNTRFTIFTPPDEVSLEDVLYTLKPYGYDVILIDYVSLLKDSDGGGEEAQWKRLGEVTRRAKRYAEANGILVVLLVQVSKEGLVKYSSTMTENANNVWVWMGSQEELEVVHLDVQQIKARNQLKFPFQLQSDSATGKITDVEDTVSQEVTEEDESTSPDAKYLKDLNDDPEDPAED